MTTIQRFFTALASVACYTASREAADEVEQDRLIGEAQYFDYLVEVGVADDQYLELVRPGDDEVYHDQQGRPYYA